MKYLVVVLSLLTSACAVPLTALESALAARSHFDAKYEATQGSNRLPQFNELKTRIESWGFTIDETRPEKEIGYGRLYPKDKVLMIASDLPVNAKFEVLAHEAGHIFQPTIWLQDGYRAEGEVFAELVAQGVANYYGFPEYTKASERYLLAYKHAAYIERLFRVDVQIAVEHIVGLRQAPKFPY